jgi:threonine dehydrogenase-like Zn-dependent dehydrogenase
MKALVFERNVPRFAAARVASALGGSGRAAGISPLRLVDLDSPQLPDAGWQRVKAILAGICGSDLATVDGRSSRYFEELVSFPFVPGHEIVGVVEESRGAFAVGSRVVVESVIGCIPRGIDPPCEACARGRVGGCEHVAFGHLAPGLQIGYCSDTGGGWSRGGLLAHDVQLHLVPEELSDEEAVMVEPTACAVHAALCSRIEAGDTVAVIGAGTLGLVTVAAIRRLSDPGALYVGAKHEHQRQLASMLGADWAVPPEHLVRAVRRNVRSMALDEGGSRLTGGADVVIDCVGSAASLDEALATVRPRGRVVLVGMPGSVRVDLAPLWHREVELTASYAYGLEMIGADHRRSFEIAMELVASAELGRLVSARYPIERYEEAIAHAGSAGRRRSVKVVFDLQTSRPASPARRSRLTGADA